MYINHISNIGRATKIDLRRDEERELHVWKNKDSGSPPLDEIILIGKPYGYAKYVELFRINEGLSDKPEPYENRTINLQKSGEFKEVCLAA